MIRPQTSEAASSRHNLDVIICPSYSSPWEPDMSRTRGPPPFLIQTIGIGSQAYAERWTEYGKRRKPCCLPSRSKSIWVVSLDVRGGVMIESPAEGECRCGTGHFGTVMSRCVANQ